MASLSSFHFHFLLLASALSFCHVAAETNSFGLEFHHRFSDKVRSWAKEQSLPATWNPEEVPFGTPEYYETLFRHDLRRHPGRFLATGDQYAFATGNETLQYLAQLFYAFVDVGTPNQTFLVALDTGSDLFWLPCNCKQCAPNTSPNYGKIEFSNFSPNESSTSKNIPCSSIACETPYQVGCRTATDDCGYLISYASPNTSSSGILLQDVLYLVREDPLASPVQFPVVFGCGEAQTGQFLDGSGAPNGLMGLSFGNLSVPTMVSNQGLVSDSFSMCFGTDGIGRLNFGDKGSPDQFETPLIVNSGIPYYNISLTGMVIGGKTMTTPFTAVVDSGTSYTLLADPIYTQLTTSFSSQVTDQRANISGPFEYCFEISSKKTQILVPGVKLTTKGGSIFHVPNPTTALIDTTTNQLVGYCLAVIPAHINIIGENFLIGLRVVFDREKLVFGWKEMNCYGNNDTTKPSALAPAPVPAYDVPLSLSPLPSPALHRRGWAPHASPSTLLNTVISLLLMFFVLFPFN